MIISAWVALIFFGLFALRVTIAYFAGNRVNIPTAIFWFFSVLVSAISAGVIWGGLFQ